MWDCRMGKWSVSVMSTAALTNQLVSLLGGYGKGALQDL